MDYWILSLVLLAISYIIFKANEKRHYFKRWGIPQPSELPFLGAIGSNIFLGRHVSEVMKSVYNVNKEAKYIGCHMFLSPVIVLRDLDLIKSVLVKNFDHFAYHKHFVDEELDPLFGGNLAFLNGERWREVRSLLSPAFTSSKMRSMYVLMSHCAENFAEVFVERYRDVENVDVKDAFRRYANDVIATCAFGLEIDSLKNPENEFYNNGTSATKFQLMDLWKVFFIRGFPSLARIMGLRFISKKNTDYFVNVIGTTMKVREEKGITRPDMLQLMMEARKKINDLDLLEITAQAFIFFLAGYDTTSSQMCMMAHELAVNPEAQEKLQAEIDAVMEKSNSKPTYEDINSMAYLDAVFDESLRMHPIGFLSRMCSKAFELPPALPDSKPYVVKEGTEIFVPNSGIHTDPNYFENPEKFDPERYTAKKVTTGDTTNLGFGMGPRMCIGNRFATLETKVLFAHLLHKCSIVPCKRTRIPLTYTQESFGPAAKGGSWFKIKLRK